MNPVRPRPTASTDVPQNPVHPVYRDGVGVRGLSTAQTPDGVGLATTDMTHAPNCQKPAAEPVTSWHAAPSVGPLGLEAERLQCTARRAEQRITDPFPSSGRALTCGDARPANAVLTLGGRS